MSEMYRRVLIGALVTARDALDTALTILRGAVDEGEEEDDAVPVTNEMAKPATFHQERRQ